MSDYFQQQKEQIERMNAQTAHDFHRIEFREMCAKMIDEVIGAPATVRLSAYLYTTKEEIDAFVNEIKNGGDILDAYFFN